MTLLYLLVNIFLSCRAYPAIEGYLDQQKERAQLESHRVENDEFRLHYWKGGNPSGETILFLHGFGGDAMWAWGRNFPDFSDQYQIIAVDLLWFGESVAYEGTPSLEQQRRAVEAVLIKEEIEQLHVVALSYGGFVALQLVENGWAIEKLALVGVAGGVDLNQLEERYSEEHLSEIFVPSQKEDVRRLLDICFHTPTVFIPMRLSDDLYQTVFGRYPVEQRLLMADLVENMEVYARLIPSSVRDIEGLIIAGALDPIFSLDNVNELAVQLGATMIVYPRADHVPNIGYPRRFNNDIHLLLNGDIKAE